MCIIFRKWEKGVQCGEGELFVPKEGIKKGKYINNLFVLRES